MDVLIPARISEIPMPLVFLVATAAATTLLVLATRRRSRASRSAGPARTSPMSGAGHARASDEMRDLLVELQDFARDTVAQIDSRCHKLEALIRDADARAARLAELTGREPEVADKATTDSRNTDHGGLDILVGDAGPQVEPQPPRRAATSDYRRVCELADQGMSAVNIAQRLDRPVGEIELIVSLHSQAAAPDGS